MKLTEKQLQNWFQNHSEKNHSKTTASEILNAAEASSTRLQQAEQLLDDHHAAQGFKLAVALKPWSEAVAESTPKSAANTALWNIFPKLRLTFAIAVIAAALPIMLQKTTQNTTLESIDNGYVRDSISVSAFEPGGDQLSNGSFEQNITPVIDELTDGEDLLFKSKFG